MDHNPEHIGTVAKIRVALVAVPMQNETPEQLAERLSRAGYKIVGVTSEGVVLHYEEEPWQP